MDRKQIENIFQNVDPKKRRLMAIVGILGAALIALSVVTPGSSPPRQPAAPVSTVKTQPSSGQATGASPILRYGSELDQELDVSLSRIQGAGHVAVTVTLAGSPVTDYATNTTDQKTVTNQRDAQGGTQTTTSNQDTHQVVTQQGGSPVVSSQSAPRIVGVLVVASGATDPLVRQTLTTAVETLLGLPPNAVTVLPKGA